jgi:pimeloyl-ACP methyl ester carboxylesterase
VQPHPSRLSNAGVLPAFDAKPKLLELFLLAFINFVFVIDASSQQIAKSLTAANGVNIGFYEYKPEDYNDVLTVKYPLIIFLHGIGERGNGTTDLWKVKRLAIPHYIDQGHDMRFTWNGKTETFLVLSPQCHTSTRWYYANYYVEEMIKYAKSNLRVDPDRIIVTGLSMGGGGTWKYASQSIPVASSLAAIAPVSAPCFDSLSNYEPTMTSGNIIAGSQVPVWTFHAVDDANIFTPIQCFYDAVDSIYKYNPVVKPIETVYSNGGHFIWDRAYSTDYTYQSPNIYEWFLAQNASLPANSIPVAHAGADSTVLLANGTARLNGSNSADQDGSLVKSRWKKISGPNSGTIVNPSALNTTVTGLSIAGTYTYELQTVDDRVGWSYDTVSITVSSVALPVQWQYFNASVEGYSKVVLQWATASEISSEKFEVQRSSNGIAYETIAAIAAAGNTSTEKRYSFSDLSPLRGDSYYRLRQIDRSGDHSFSKVVKVLITETSEISIAPNPAKDFIELRSNRSPIFAVQLLEMSGRILQQQSFNQSVANTIRFNVSAISRGMYLFRIVAANGATIKKIVID